MARIPEEVIERLKEEVSLQRLVELAGVELRQKGKDLVGLCPFHEERTASLVISPEKNLWHCMGACQAGGSVIDWVMRAEGVSFRHAVELLRDGVAPSALSGPRVTRSTVAKLPSPLPIGAGERELLERVVGFYAQTLKESPEALGVLERRGLDDPGLIEEFRLGYANRTLGYRLPAKNRKPGAELRGKLQELGVFRATGHEHLSGSLVIPVGDVRGEVVQLYGRKLRDDLNHRGSSRHLYLPGPRRGVFNAKALPACGGELVVCESLIDALTFWRHGLRHVTAAFGADGFTDELHKALSEAGVGRVLIAFDRDEAGDRGAAALADRLGGDGVECFRVLFPAGQDANSFACGVKEPAGALAQLLREAVWIGAGEPAARPAPAPVESESESVPAGDPSASAPVEPEQGGARAQLEQHGDTEDEPVQGDLPSAAKAAALSSPPPSSPVPRPPSAQPVVKLDGEELRVEIEDRRWRIRGLGKASSFELLRVNVLVARTHPRRGEVFHVDSLDLYSARARGVFARQAGEELGVAEELVARDLGRVLLTCEEHAERAVREAQAPSGGTVTYLHHDQQGSTRLLTGSTGTVTGKCTYSAYGAPTCEGTTTTPLGYDAQYTSSDTGLVYLRNRVYDPATAQFLTVDPLVGQTHAPYYYAGDNPLTYGDAVGLLWTPLAGGAGGADAACGATIEIPGLDIGTCGAAGIATGAAAVGAAIGVVTAVAGNEGGDEGEAELKAKEAERENCGNPASPPSESGWEWRGKGPVGSKEGAWFNPDTEESLHPDLNNEDHGPHYDYKAPDGSRWRIYPDGRIEPQE